MLTRLPHRVVIQSLTTASADGGCYTETWSTASTNWANIQPISTTERYNALKAQQYITHNVTMRQDVTITTANRIKYGNRIFHIETKIDPTERSRMMTLKCREEVDN